MRYFLLLAAIALFSTACEPYYTFTGVIQNNSNRRVIVFYYNDDSPTRHKVDSTVVAAGSEATVRTQTYQGNKGIGESCNSMVFGVLGDSIVAIADTNRVLIKNIRSDNNWSRTVDKYNVKCSFVINQTDF